MNSKFKPPTYDDMELYASKIGFPVLEINKFQDYYESNGWRVGRNPMKCWKAAMRNWKRNYDERRYGGNGNTGFGVGPVVPKPPNNPRNFGVAINGTDYAAAARAKAQRDKQGGLDL